ncbi:GNAT family N-acetyltransferase [Pseudonocardia humida]|uniref:GNAT family N-acetyltransferase n=1 Tax=Pseudonocardia humida TaxID=2800819 RepID=A0ABT0ZYX8_9PSEU|nr:GNAT family N-acetyltransferase [Pseudonocardia humida]MCO1655926.1 GNAT family N-acetyltransferase [Pseudonocardia humida]
MIALALPLALRHRPLRPSDAATWAELLAAAEAVDRLGRHYDAQDCALELADPDLDHERDAVLVLDGDRPVACQVLWVRGPVGEQVVEADGVVHPDHRGRGIGTALVGVARDRAVELGARLDVRVAESMPAAVAMAERSGLVPVRWWSELRRDLAAPVVAPPVPEGVELHMLGPDYDGARWDRALCTARNASFADHFGSVPDELETFVHHRTANRNFRSECSIAARTPDGVVVGFVLCEEFAAATARTGRRDLYVDTVGTVPSWRGRGLAAALLARVLGRARELGYASSSLTVDATNPTGALGVYGRAGYVLHRRDVTYALPQAG